MNKANYFCWKKSTTHQHLTIRMMWDYEASRSYVFSSDCVLFCVIVLRVRVEFVQCTFVFVDKR
ncbi:hypothetical protein T11_7278 [Trichinella zimbabwensis]|uniref:Uncharacterized protein n=1 Tax=Trichinella zimbabwensis TaxID=268475 RepID=A0A0V1H4H5_9BILA|nr:hypothetical protein T11_7278 [Trichinella zimbabwensis]